MQENRSPHILNTSSTLMGLCFVVLTSIKVSNSGDRTLIDETTALAIILFMTSSILSFLSMRSTRGSRLEKTADIIFLSGMIVLFISTILVTFDVIL
jgi:hypothetical protein